MREIFSKKIVYVAIISLACLGSCLTVAKAATVSDSSEKAQVQKVAAERTIVGTISSISADRNMMIVRVSGRNITVVVTPKTVVWESNMMRMRAADLRVGDSVSVTGMVTKVTGVTSTRPNGLIIVMSASSVRERSAKQ